MYERVLLSLDGSTLAQAGVPHAARLAGPEGHVDIVTIIPSEAMLRQSMLGSAYEMVIAVGQSLDEHVASAHWEVRTNAQKAHEQAEAELKAAGVQHVTSHIREGLAGNGILDALTEFNSGAVVLGTRGYGGLGREVLGSVAEYVLRHSGEAAVVLVGPRAHTS